MAPAQRFVLPIMLVILISVSVKVIATKDDFATCQNAVKNWAVSSLLEEGKEDKHTLKDLFFFLHIPRTGGRTYFECFLRKLYTYMECPRSYDKLRFDPSHPNCRLLVTHDDYSIMSRLPKERTSVMTIVRSPIDRVLSNYEFSVEVASRFLVHPNLSSVARMRSKKNGVSTLDIWPWKYLVPWMREDLFTRRDARRGGQYRNIEESSDPYNRETFLMPLHKYINDPIAHDIIHNGATFQIAGLTNNSRLAEAHILRHCVRKYRDLGEYVLEVAKKRLDSMLYVGLTEDHKESASMFAKVVGEQVLSQLQGWSSTVKNTAVSETGLSSTVADSKHDNDHLQNTTNNEKAPTISSTKNNEARNVTMTVDQLLEAYEDCIPNLRKTESRRRTISLKKLSANFSKEARLQISAPVLQQIISLNSLDMELYEHAKNIFAEQRKRLKMKLVETERVNNALTESYGNTPWNGFMVTILLVLMFIVILVTARRRASKVKV